MDLTVLNLELPELSAALRPSAAELLWVVDMHGFLVAGLLITMGTLILAELRAMPQEEIAVQLGTSRNAVYKLCHDARRSLQRALEQAGYSAERVRWAFVGSVAVWSACAAREG
jgi:biotin operon repressor